MKHHSEEDMLMYKVYEKVLVDGVEATIRDIYCKTFRIRGTNGEEDKFIRHLTYRIHEKAFWCQDVAFERIQKLNGEINFQLK